MREPITHEMKTWPVFFEAILRGDKTFELRKDDRGFLIGDTLLLQEYENFGQHLYTGRSVRARVTYIMRGPDFGLQDGWVCMAIQKEEIPYEGREVVFKLGDETFRGRVLRKRGEDEVLAGWFDVRIFGLEYNPSNGDRVREHPTHSDMVWAQWQVEAGVANRNEVVSVAQIGIVWLE